MLNTETETSRQDNIPHKNSKDSTSHSSLHVFPRLRIGSITLFGLWTNQSPFIQNHPQKQKTKNPKSNLSLLLIGDVYTRVCWVLLYSAFAQGYPKTTRNYKFLNQSAFTIDYVLGAM